VKRSISKLKVTIAVAVLFCIAFLPLVLFLFRTHYDREQTYIPNNWSNDKRTFIPLDQSGISVTFSPTDQLLAGFDFVLVYEGDTLFIPIELVLSDSSEEIKTLSITQDAYNHSMKVFTVRFEEPINVDVGEKYQIHLRKMTLEDQEVSIVAANYDTNSTSEWYVEGKKQAGDIAVVPVYEAENLGQFLAILKDRMYAESAVPTFVYCIIFITLSTGMVVFITIGILLALGKKR